MFIVDTGYFGLPAARVLIKKAQCAVTVAPDAAEYENVVFAVLNAAKAAQADICVYAGAQRSMLTPYANLKKVPAATSAFACEAGHASVAMVELAKQHGKITIVCLGPLTNVALAIMKHDDFKNHVERIIFAGGAELGYNAETPVAEYNVVCDAEAADTVFKSGIPLYMVPFNAAKNIYAAAACFALNPAVALQTLPAFIDADVSTSFAHGQTVIDPIGRNPINFKVHDGTMNTVIKKVDETLVETMFSEAGVQM